MKRTLTIVLLCCATSVCAQQAVREHLSIDEGWRFAFGDASSPASDFGHGTEYFNYLTKANSKHNEGPYSKKFDDSAWKVVDLPHDWVVDLPYAKEASHSHGYKTVGYKYPKTSVGWYRKTLVIQPKDAGRRLSLQFDGIFRDSKVWANGFYLGSEPSGYLSHTYDVTDYIDQTRLESGIPDTLRICVRADATFEEGWFYEGAGIYRHAWLNITEQLHFVPNGIVVNQKLSDDYQKATLTVSAEVEKGLLPTTDYALRIQLLPKNGEGEPLVANGASLTIQQPRLWSPSSPYLYIVRTQLLDKSGKLCDSVDTTIGFREVRFDANEGLFINGEHVKIHGACMHQDHAGVGAGMPDELQVWRLTQLKKWGFNAYRSSHNPMTPETIAACDSLGFLVIEENRLLGISDYQLTQLKSMIRRDRNHPSIISWSVGNEEWGVEWNPLGTQIVRSMCEYVRSIDPTRLATVATSTGPAPVDGADIAGYNYVTQNPIDERRQQFPNRIAYGSEETSGCGTRGIYWDDIENGRMAALNRTADQDGTINRIERGLRFYDERPWLLGCFFWTGFDYRGEANPLV
ncbi:MAG: beta-galactosidase, partial [Bacteroidaceae bacterium]|nr:beta-galactosidase [Bacteroidaceae bacterium]